MNAALAYAEPFAWPVEPISTAPQDGSRVLLWLPAHRLRDGSDREGRWMLGRWFVDERPGPDVSQERWRLISRHGGYWSAHFQGGTPLRGRPTLWAPLPPDPDRR